MDSSRTVEDQLRAEYFDLLPDIRRAVLETETRVRRDLLEVSLTLERYERLLVTSRIKECDSAVDALRRRQPLGLFDAGRATEYSLMVLPDLAAVRVMGFPERRVDDAQRALMTTLSTWTADPIPSVNDSDKPLARKYFGKWSPNAKITAEVQIVGLLIGLFWEVEHSAIYKPNPNLRGVIRSGSVIQRRDEVLTALQAFEAAFEDAIATATLDSGRDTTGTAPPGGAAYG
jgi:ppGpp synthetase/RelA/SpoT-type nucleotidyltranferase